MLLHSSGFCGFAVKLPVMTEDVPPFPADDLKPFVIGHLLRKFLVLMPLNHDRRLHENERPGKARAKVPVKIEG